jgi:hypothetical protein
MLRILVAEGLGACPPLAFQPLVNKDQARCTQLGATLPTSTPNQLSPGISHCGSNSRFVLLSKIGFIQQRFHRAYRR